MNNANIVTQLISYWREPDHLSPERHSLCRQVSKRVLQKFSNDQAAKVIAQPEEHQAELEDAIQTLVQQDPISRELIRHLSSQPARHQRPSSRPETVINISVSQPPAFQAKSEDTTYWLRLQLSEMSEGKFNVRVLPNPWAGEPNATSHLPFPQEQLAAILKALEFAQAPQYIPAKHWELLNSMGFAVNDCLIIDFAEQVGRHLYLCLFPDKVASAVETIGQRARQERKPFVLQLCFDETATNLAYYPWELIHNEYQPLLSGMAYELVRDITYPQARTNLKTKPPWRLLYTAPRPQNETPLPSNDERVAVENGLQSLQADGVLAIDYLESPTYDHLLEQLTIHEYHILHFDGHGGFVRRCPGCQKLYEPHAAVCRNCHISLLNISPKGYLAFEDSNGQVDWVETEAVGQLLSGNNLGLVFLSACQSAIVEGPSLFGGLGPGLIRAGIPAVVGMQFSVPVPSAIQFAKSFYLELSQTGQLSRALARGRQALYRAKQWFIPVLYLRNAENSDRFIA
jgi:hypothetical protein